MFVIIPTRLLPMSLIAWLRSMVLLIVLMTLMLLAGSMVLHAGRSLLAAQRSPGAFDVMALFAALGAGCLLIKLGRQLSKSPMDDEGGGLFSAVGFKAWMIFLLVLGAFGGGVYLGATDRMDGQAHLPYYSQQSAGQSPKPGKIFIAQPVPAKPASAPATPSHQ